ncbi:MAG: CRISPR-associated endonuclease Cas2 [Bacteroides sp.]|nr:CRISPR-associated endonuclease Cas2 [Prevotella sp.]MCM1406941.1 CRISPR-associated endonuclease Cas2 [Treponema brennaborense]MCM1470092.1 CRISPR-associated endonuclease Cas2 [Bacteroides sp.]
MAEKHWLIVYDIRDVKRLAKISKCVESYGRRVQKSVFETTASDETIGHLRLRLEKLMDIEKDFILFFEICERDFQKRQIFGKKTESADTIADEDFVIL